MKLLWPKNLLLLGWMAGLGMKLKPFHLSWFVGLALVLRQVEAAGQMAAGSP